MIDPIQFTVTATGNAAEAFARMHAAVRELAERLNLPPACDWCGYPGDEPIDPDTGMHQACAEAAEHGGLTTRLGREPWEEIDL